jgi:hypothetical protein
MLFQAVMKFLSRSKFSLYYYNANGPFKLVILTNLFLQCVSGMYALSFGPVMKWKESADKSTGGE